MKAGLTQEQAVEFLPCDVRSLQRYEKGDRVPDLNLLQDMKVCYRCELADLFPVDTSPAACGDEKADEQE